MPVISSPGASSVSCVLADEVEFSPFFLPVVDGADLQEVFLLDVRPRFVFGEDALAGAGVFLVIRALAETHAVVFRVVVEAALLNPMIASGSLFESLFEVVDCGGQHEFAELAVPDEIGLEFLCERTCAVDILVVAVDEAAKEIR